MVPGAACALGCAQIGWGRGISRQWWGLSVPGHGLALTSPFFCDWSLQGTSSPQPHSLGSEQLLLWLAQLWATSYRKSSLTAWLGWKGSLALA